MKLRYFLVPLLVFSACTTTQPNLQNSECAEKGGLSYSELIYFGRDKGNGLVTATEWKSFLLNEVTPRFPDGLTWWEANGQWRSSKGILFLEKVWILNIAHSNLNNVDLKMLELINAYKALFRQTSVLKVRLPVCGTFL